MSKETIPWVDYESGEIVYISIETYNKLMSLRKEMSERISKMINLEDRKKFITIVGTHGDDDKNEDFKNMWHQFTI